jgi:subtilisin family serine protease
VKITNKINYILIIILSILLTACGSGGSSSTKLSTINSGSFVDSNVEGLTYKTSTQIGFTNSSGTFYYKTGENVSFYIGNILIGTASGSSVITPIDIVSGGNINDTKVLNIARVLQTLDSDKNTSNGITLVSEAKNLNSSLSVDFNDSAFITNLINEINTTNQHLVEIDRITAQNHLKETFSPSTTGNDPLSSNQWYLTDLNITNIHNEYNGSSTNGSTIQIVDVGIEAIHEDLFSNLDLTKSYNAETSTAKNCTPDSGESHGTACAGIIGARGYNNKGIRGINPLGKIVGFKFNTINASSFNYTQAQLEKAWIKGDGANDIDISSNSWGSCYSSSTMEENILAWGVNNLRDGKGRIYIMAGGNDREVSGACAKGSANLTH